MQGLLRGLSELITVVIQVSRTRHQEILKTISAVTVRTYLLLYVVSVSWEVLRIQIMTKRFVSVFEVPMEVGECLIFFKWFALAVKYCKA
jgi:hypothetical protein